MELQNKIQEFKAMLKIDNAYSYARTVLSIDGSTAAPVASVQHRAETMAFLAGISHERLTSPETGALLAWLDEHKTELDPQTAREVYLMKKGRDQMAKIPADEYVAYVGLLSRADVSWKKAKAADDFSIFQPDLEQIVAANIKLAGYYDSSKAPYDALLNEYEKDLNTKTLDTFFAQLRETIVPLVHKIAAKPQLDDSFLHGSFPVHLQEAVSLEIMELMGIDKERCTLTTTEHPFTSGFSRNDVRITTHYYPEHLAFALYSTIHEGGHALYELGMADELTGSPANGGASMAMHESQSRFYENLIGRSRPFMDLLLPILQKHFPEQFANTTADMLYKAVNRSEPSLIRTEADELTYCLHIMVRYEIEKQLIAGTLAVRDVPAVWNRMYKEYLGIDVPSDREGCLQDTHWAGGMFGYFPSYALGSAYGAQFLTVMERDLDVYGAVENNEIPKVTAWLGEKIHRHGCMKDPAELLESVCGAPFDAKYYTTYLEKKFSELYGL